MHMADALLSPAVAATMYAATGVTAGISVKKLTRDNDPAKIPVMAVTSALVFAGQMINYTIPGTGSSGHLCGGMLLSALLGPQAGFLSMLVILVVQSLFFADGGLMALGANCWNMAFYGCFIGYYLIWRPIMRSRMFSKLGEKSAVRMRVILASIVGCVITLQLGSLSVVTETTLSGIAELPFAPFCALMQPIHLVIGLIEGLITAAVLCFVLEMRPALLTEADTAGRGIENRHTLRTVVIILAVLAILVGGALSLLASSNPDGLEWSLFGNKDSGYSENMALNEDDYGVKSDVADAAGKIQDKTAFLPDYGFKGDSSGAGTSASGIIGVVIVAAVAAGICVAGGALRKKQKR